jgi:glycosyltransferase involved in cell wall biosynthesis
VVGGRIVLADGSLQEAGCITFSDGSTIGYGRGQDPQASEFQFVRDVDFCSGAFMLVRADLWRSLDGFDSRYAPAYYEDTDFCLRVREAGYRVVYEPNAVMLHVEGGSALEGEPEKLMRHNQDVFLQRHPDLLRRCSLPGQADLTVQRWARNPGSRILIVDDAVPYVVAGSGFVRARLLIQALSDQHVTLLPFHDTESDWRTVYESVPETVEVILGSGQANFEDFLRTRHGVYNVLLVSRPPNMAFIADLHSKQPDLFHGMHIVYDSEAIFAEREIIAAELAGKTLTPSEQTNLLLDEMEHARPAERVLAVSQHDAAQFRQAGFTDVRIAAHAQEVRYSSPDVDNRSGMLFVGALNPDTPNEDGLLWFVREVMPRLREGLPLGITLSIVGECRSNKVAALASPDVHILGRINDLTPLYDKARLFVAPVRYAAGVPAKAIEAAGNGLPVVASEILARQLDWNNETEILSAGSSKEFAAAIIRLVREDTLWQCLRRRMLSRTAEQFAPEVFADEIRAAVTFPRQS